ncbi:MAG: hypothetical protein KDA60_23030, partial [Planctomycetales bacterium]|nr:hypothetical protein [Planctomycetales bacterium]
RLVESLLLPSREIGPRFKTVLLELDDGEIVKGFPFGQVDGGRQELLLNEQGEELRVETLRIAARHWSDVSIMPDNLIEALTIEEFQDVIALLRSR